MFVLNLAVLVWAARAAERTVSIAWLQRRLLVGGGSGAFSLWGGAVFAALLAAYSGPLLARGSDVVVIADFEGGPACPPWWGFGAAAARLGPRQEGGTALWVHSDPGGSSGVGLYVIPQLGIQRTFQLDVFGGGQRSGRLKIELLEDDSGDWEIQKGAGSHLPEVDDRFMLELTVDWHGWRTLALPASSFRTTIPAAATIASIRSGT